MTPRSLFNIILKTVGIFFLKDLVVAIPQIAQVLIQAVPDFGDDNLVIFTSIFAALQLFVYGGFCFYLLFRTDYVIKKLKLEDGFDQDSIVLNIHRSTVLSIAIIIIGSLLILDSVPYLLRSIYVYMEEKRLMQYEKPGFSQMIIYCSKIIAGLILIGNHRLLVNYIERKRQGHPVPDTVEESDTPV
jgi:hypothetical protein